VHEKTSLKFSPFCGVPTPASILLARPCERAPIRGMRDGREPGRTGVVAVYGGAVRPIMLLAAVLVAEGVSFVLVGSAALYLHS